MFDFEYNTNVGFIPRIAVLKSMSEAAEEELDEMQEAVEQLSENVAEQSSTVAENSAAIAENADAISENSAAIADEVEAREQAVEELNERINNIPKFQIKVVDVLPQEGEPGVIYLLQDEGKDTYSEYVYADGKWEKLGTDVDLTDYVQREEFEDAIGSKADISDVYSKAEADALFLTEHQDISGLASKEELENAVAPLAEMSVVETLVSQEADARSEGVAGALDAADAVAADLAAEVNTRSLVDDAINDSISNISGSVENVTLELASVDEKLIGLAEANAVQDEKIATLTTDYKKLKEIVGDLGGDVEYDVPGDGKLTDVLKKSGTVKLMEDVESATYTGGLTSKNVTTLNTNGKTLTFTGATVNNPGIMTKGSEQLTIVGKGTIDGNGRIAVEANGANSVINLSGSTGFFGAEPTYVTDRSGGELIYCYLGIINIYAGIFKNNGENKGFTLNCYDANYRSGKANIVVMGGKFYDFDPANNAAEGEGTSFVPEGYESVHTTEEIDGVIHDVYTVKKSA